MGPIIIFYKLILIFSGKSTISISLVIGKGNQCQTPSLRKKDEVLSIQNASIEFKSGNDLSSVAGARQIIPIPKMGINA